MKGSVKFFNDVKNFGFIAGEDGKEYFVHSSGLTEGTNIRENDSVTFEVVEGERGPKAESVALDTGDSAPAEDAPVEEAQADEAPAEDAPAEEATEEEAPAEEAPAEEATEEDSEEKKE